MHWRTTAFIAIVALALLAGCRPSTPAPKPTPSPRPPALTLTPAPRGTATVILELPPPTPPRKPLSADLPPPTPRPTLQPTAAPTPRPTATPTARPTFTLTPYPQRTIPPLPQIARGQTINPGVAGKNMAFSFLDAFESDLAVVSYRGSFYGYRARSGYKFLIVEYRFQNTSNEEQTTPQLNSGDLLTGPKGFIYKLWAPPTPTSPNPYNAYLTTADEGDRLGHSTGGNVKLRQEFGARGRIIFEIPVEMAPEEISLAGITARLVLNGN